MKFSEYKYQRPNLEEIKRHFDKAIEIIKSGNAEEQIKAVEDINIVRGHFNTMGEICSIRHSIDTLDKFYDEETNFFDEQGPIYSDWENNFFKALVSSNHKKELVNKFGQHWFNMLEVSLKTFDPIIIEDLQNENKLVSEYSKLIATGIVEFNGEKLPLPKMSPYMQDKSRQVRHQANEAVSKFYQDNDDKFGGIYDKLVHTRDSIAKKLGFKDFVELGYYRMCRTDYNEEMVANYRKQIYEELVPLVNKLSMDKAKRLGVDDPYNYDFTLSFLSGNPTPKGDRAWQVQQAKTMYHQMSKETDEFFNYMVEHELLDLDSKPGKQSGGYCTFIDDYKSPFIFANFNGTSHDVDVLTHEAGHAFQVYTSREHSIPEYHFPTYEACEIHSMSMEFFAWPYTNLFFKEDTDKYHYFHLSESIIFIPYGATVDEFQHEVYKNPNLTPDERKALWRKIETKYLPFKKYDNAFLDSGTYWYRQGHIFQSPFYYIDYTLAQICAHQFWIKDHQDHQKAWKDYYHLCTLGGSMSFLNLVKEANLENPFVSGTIKKIVTPLKEWLESFDQSKLK